MKLKAAVRYYLNDFKKPVVIFYGILMVLFLLQLIIAALVHEDPGSYSGMEFATTIFLLVAGLNAFKAQFRLFLQNGLSRKTLFTGFVAGILILAASMTLIDLAFGWFRGLFAPYQTIYLDRFGSLYADKNSLAALADGLLWSFLAYVTAGMTGFMISSLYYRMSKAWKLIVSIGVPMLVFVGIPLIDGLYTNGAITAFLINVLAFAFGFGVTIDLSKGFAGLLATFFRQLEDGIPLYPYRAILFSVLCTAFTGTLSFLLIRRATIKE
jgi:hypothetical protein